MSYATAVDDYKRVVQWGWRERQVLMFMAQADMAALLAALANYDVPTASRMGNTLEQRLEQLRNVRTSVQAALMYALANIARELRSGSLAGGQVDPEQAFKDWRRHMEKATGDGGADQYVTARRVYFGAEPAAGDGVQYFRLTVDENGQPIETGLHNETVHIEVTGVSLTGQGAGQVSSVIYGQDGGNGALDYRRGSGRAEVAIAQNNERNIGRARNADLRVRGATAHATAVTDATLDDWDLVLGSGGTAVVSTDNPFRTKTYGIAFGGAAQTSSIEQEILLPQDNPQDPGLPFAAFHYDGTWEGTLALRWGSKSVTVAHAALGSAGFKYLVAPRDKNLHPRNFDNGASKLKLELEHTNGSGTLTLQYVDLLPPTRYQNAYIYSAPTHELPALPVPPNLATIKTFSDAVTFDGKIQDITAWAFLEVEYAYLNTAGANLVEDPSPAPPTMQAYSGVTAVNDSGSIALGNTLGAQEVPVRITNTGSDVLVLDAVEFDNDSNCTPTDGNARALALLPGETRTVLITVTPSGAGAYSVDVVWPNNTATDPYTITISGTDITP